jgi:hypothetical protein
MFSDHILINVHGLSVIAMSSTLSVGLLAVPLQGAMPSAVLVTAIFEMRRFSAISHRHPDAEPGPRGQRDIGSELLSARCSGNETGHGLKVELP